MIVSCPQCKTRYKIDDSAIPLSGRKMRCAKCGEIWRAYPRVEPEEEVAIPAVEPAPLVSESPKTTGVKETRTEKSPAFWGPLFKMAAFLLFILALISAYVFRYPIVERFPGLEAVYKGLGLESTVPGRGLEFKDISFQEYDDADFVHKMDVSGKIINSSGQDTALPLLHIELLDGEGNILQNIDQALSMEFIRKGTSAGFKVTIINPAPFTKYVYVTFTGGQ